MVKFLRGEKSKKLTKYEFDHLKEFGALAHLPKKSVLEYIDAMIERGCLSVGNFLLPMLKITDVGKKRLERMVKP